MKEFKQVREGLLDMLEDLDERLTKITDNSELESGTDIDDGSEELSNSASNEVDDDHEGHAMRNEMNRIKQAISKIDSGTYGICLSCGQPIKREYLHTAPFSSHCLNCIEDNNGKK